MGTFEDFKRGIRCGIPICMGYIAVSFAFGLQASAIGLSVFQAVLISLMNVTSAGQFSALELIVTQASLAEMALLQLVVNLRYMLMSTALTQKLNPGTSTLHRLLIAYGVTDEIFGVSVLQKGELKPSFSYGLITISVGGWLLGTFLGAAAGQILPQRLISALGLAIYGMFIAIIIPDTRTSVAVRNVVLSAMALSALFTWLPTLSRISSGFRIILVTLIVALLAAYIAPIPDKTPEQEEVDHDA